MWRSWPAARGSVPRLFVHEERSLGKWYRGSATCRRNLIITGETDKRIPVANQRQAESRMRTAGIHVESHHLQDADHFLLFTHRVGLLRIVSAWLTR